ncbi:MAG: hypothetical protein H8D22_08775 [Candidatus Cloacimonetes bacterium]|nr:hypothetical protein [Candidatus Cloacimonadota bacterium]
MKKPFIILAAIILLIPLESIALDGSIWYKFPIPEYSYSQAYITIPDFLNWKIHGDDNDIYIRSGISYSFFLQNHKITVNNYGNVRAYVNKYEHHYGSDVYKKDERTIAYYNNFTGAIYFGKFNVWSEGLLRMYAQKGRECRTDLELEVGGGIGRIVKCTAVVQAIRLIKELKIKEDEELILQIADLYAKKSTFSRNYPDTWEEIFYQKIAEMVGLPDQALKVKRILTNGIYETVSRSSGWEVKFGYGNNFFTGIDPHSKGFVVLNAEYHIPWGLTKQVTFQTEYMRDLDVDSSLLGAGAFFEIEHSYTWASHMQISGDKIFNSLNIDKNMNYCISVGTEKNIFNKLVAGLSVEYTKISQSLDPYFKLLLDLKYYLL